MPFFGLLTAGIIGAGASIFSGIEGSNAAKTASSQEVNQQQQALDFQKQMFATQQANQAPYLAAGNTSLGKLMGDLQSGQLGPGSLGAVPQFTGSFSAPTLAEAQQTPGYQFTAQQGSKGILQGAGAAGGAISGGTLKALDSFNTGLADSTYNDVFNRALQTYNTGLQGYQAQLQGYQTGANAQQQGFNQLLAPAQLGENATANINQTGTQVSQNVGNLMSQIGQSEAAGTVGSANAITSGVSGAAGSASQTLLLSQLLPLLQGAKTGGKATTPTDLSIGANQPIDWGTLYGGVPA